MGWANTLRDITIVGIKSGKGHIMAFVQANDEQKEKRRARAVREMELGMANILAGYKSYEAAGIAKAKMANDVADKDRKATREDFEASIKMGKDMGLEPSAVGEVFDGLNPKRNQSKRRRALEEEEQKVFKEAESEKDRQLGEINSRRPKAGFPMLGGMDNEDESEEALEGVNDEFDSLSKTIRTKYEGKREAVPLEPDYEGIKGILMGANPNGSGGEKFLDKRLKQERLKKAERENSGPYTPFTPNEKEKNSRQRIVLMEEAKTRAESRAEKDRIETEIRREKDKIQEEGRKVTREQNEKVAEADLQIEDLNKIEKKLDALGEIGPFRDKIENLKAYAKSRDPKWVDFVAEVTRTITPMINKAIGASQSDAEKEMVLGFLPDTKKDSDEDVRIKLRGFRDYLKRRKSSSHETIIKNRSEEENLKRFQELKEKAKAKRK